MRTRFLILCFGVMLLLLACSRNELAGAGKKSATQLAGNWELQEAQTGMLPNTQFQAGNGNRYRFTETTYEQYKDGQLAASGSYTIVQDTTVEKEVGLVVPAGEFRQRIVFSNNTTEPKVFFQRTATQLVLLSGYFPLDGGSRLTYGKIADDSGR